MIEELKPIGWPNTERMLRHAIAKSREYRKEHSNDENLAFDLVFLIAEIRRLEADRIQSEINAIARENEYLKAACKAIEFKSTSLTKENQQLQDIVFNRDNKAIEYHARNMELIKENEYLKAELSPIHNGLAKMITIDFFNQLQSQLTNLTTRVAKFVKALEHISIFEGTQKLNGDFVEVSVDELRKFANAAIKENEEKND